MKHMKYIKPMTAAALSVTLLGTAVVPVYADTASKEKQEVIYVMTDASGRVDDIEVVNIFPGGKITDYGDYSAVKILNTTDKVSQEGDKISISSSADKVYYQGTLKEKKIPWDISIRYFLDGKEYEASELAGKSGALEIQFAVSENQSGTDSFYDDYALQASFTLDTEKCTNITAEGATLANVGSNKQISYTILPGRGIDAVIQADVTDFTMDAASVNGIKLDLNVEIDDTEIKNQVNDLIDAVKQLDDGAVKLSDGTEELSGGTSDLKTGASALHSGSTALDEGITALQNGLSTVQNGLNSLNAQSASLVKGSAEYKEALKTIQTALNSVSVSEKNLTELVDASGKIKKAVSDLNTGAATLQANLGYAQYKAVMEQNGLNIDELAAGNQAASEKIGSYIGQIDNYEELIDQSSQIPEQYKPYVETFVTMVLANHRSEIVDAAGDIQKLFIGNNAALGGMKAYLNGVSAELPKLTEGLAELNKQYETFDAAIGSLVSGLSSMTGNLSALAGGINQLVAYYEKMDSGVNAYTDGVSKLAAGYGEVMKGVSALAKGSKELVSGSGELYDGTARLYDGVTALCDGAKDMAEGTGTFREETSGMNDKIEEEIDSILETIGGSMENPVSFVSSKNTSVDSVQFVIKTAAIEKAEVEETETAEPKQLNFGQKLLKLFGLNS